MNKDSFLKMSHNAVHRSVLLGVLCLVVALAGLVSMQQPGKPFHSVEVAVAEHSPLGESGGEVVPASCPSYSHNALTTGLNCGACPIGYDWVSYQTTCFGGDVSYACPYDQCDWVGCPAGYVQNGNTCDRDYCPNIAGTQASVPPGYTVDGSGNCVVACTTDPSSPQSQTVACPAGQTGSILQQRSSVCPGPTWSAWSTISNSCSASPNITITATGTRVHPGDVVTITWTTTNTTNWNCTLTGPNTTASGLNGSVDATILAQSDFIINCTRTGYTAVSKTLRILILPAGQEV